MNVFFVAAFAKTASGRNRFETFGMLRAMPLRAIVREWIWFGVNSMNSISKAAEVARRASRAGRVVLGALAAVAATVLVSAPASAATTYVGTYTGADYTDAHFTFGPTIFFTYNAASDGADFLLTSDSNGNNQLFLGESISGPSAGSTILYFAKPSGPTYVSGGFSPDPWTLVAASDIPFVPNTGTFTNGTDTLTITAVPEPDSWSLMIIGSALAGGALRLARRRRVAMTAA